MEMANRDPKIKSEVRQKNGMLEDETIKYYFEKELKCHLILFFGKTTILINLLNYNKSKGILPCCPFTGLRVRIMLFLTISG
ncbi:hypothetical protein BHC47_03465 [Snodgrassella alvi]|uniref:Uncharacterized protein n=1 Tax=Snodgrassella alvi TaxID=1196083 RepID=A0A2N9Y5K5_9NEIS|nr:hypothetical protein BHC47_03465 [Snodgrassella alvi]PIT65273.1 hypothetical protein BHC56_10885 [Snodgrassella alvi]